MKYKLSFCIPTYNRSEYLSQTLANIIPQLSEDVEIVISDNASDDDTQSMVSRFMEDYPNIKYFRWDSNMGADINYLKTVELASGEYCWLLGSDDFIEAGAVTRVLKEINDKHDIYLCSEYLCDLDMKPYDVHYLLEEGIEDSIYNFSDDSELYKYFTLAQSQSALFGYLSSIIFKRSKWNDVCYDEKYTGTLYSHMFMLYSFIDKGCQLKYIKQPLVYWRGGNDSFGGAGKIQSRYLVDINGFKMIMDDFFEGKDKVKNAFKTVFRRHHPIKNIAYLRLNVDAKSDWIYISSLLKGNYDYDRVLLSVISPSAAKPALYLLFQVHRVFMKIKRTFFYIRK
ncbi:glycosyltransferase family 2 protein [Vibrio sp. T187]|uniref:glycosyltransferase family 2 protein n=1 Tax=Vibrio TaxID=662 RepID=UPI0010C9AF0F|nr:MULTISPECIES: glycosyltransferase family 2 protein [Vibrio]MBW3697564.1 glycosyltransferase family 2 protein [Vibrio sp. T187]